MGALKSLCFVLVLGTAMPAQAEGVEDWRAHIDEASQRFGIPRQWVERVMRAESGGRTRLNGVPIVSPAGAMGLMQLMPGTWAEMRRRLGLGSDPHTPRDNILAGTFYLRLMYERFGYPGLFGAYNAGPARYAAYVEGRRALPAETRAYLAGPGEPASAISAASPANSSGGLFFAMSAADSDAKKASPVPSALFVPLGGMFAASGPGATNGSLAD